MTRAWLGLLLLSACSSGVAPDGGAEDSGVSGDAGHSVDAGAAGDAGPTADAGPFIDAGLPSCGPWTAAPGNVLGTDVRWFSAADDLVVFKTVPGRTFARRLSTATERELFEMPLLESARPSQNRVLAHFFQ